MEQSEREMNPVMDQSLITRSEDSSDIKFSFGKLSSLVEFVLPTLWIYAACEGSYGSTLLHMFFILFYAIGMNSVRKMNNYLYKWPFLFVLLSQVYSLAYIIGESIIYSMPREKRIKITEIMTLFDIFNADTKKLFKTPYFSIQIAITVIDFIYITSRSTFVMPWFKQSRIVLIRHLMVIIRPAFLFTLAVMSASAMYWRQKFIAVIFALTIVSFCVLSFNLPYFITYIYWVIFILGDFAYIAYNDSKWANTTYTWIPRWAIVASASVNLLFIGMIIGVNRESKIHSIRLLKQVKAPIWLLDIIPYVVIINSCVFCVCGDSWFSYSVLTIACISSLFGVDVLQKSSRFVLAIQAVQYVLNDATKLEQKYNFLVCCIQAISAVFVHCAPILRATPTQQENHPILQAIIQYVMTFILLAYVLLNTIFSSKLHFLAYDIPLIFLIIVLLLKLFYSWIWSILNVITFVSMSIYFIHPIAHLEKYNIPKWIYDTTVTTEPYEMLSRVWPFFALFITTAILKYYYRPPPSLIVQFSKTIGVFATLCLSCIYIYNSAFTVAYQALILCNLFLYRFQPYLLFINSVITVLHIAVNIIYCYPGVPEFINQSKIIASLLGLHMGTHFDVTTRILIPNVILILYTFFASIARKYESEGRRELHPWIKTVVDNIWGLVIKFSFYLFWCSIFLVVMVSEGVSIVGAVMIVVLGIFKVTGLKTNAIGIILFIIFMVDVLVVTAIDILPVNKSIKHYAELTGPLVNTYSAKFANVLVCLCAFINMITFNETHVHSYVKFLGNMLASILLAIVVFSMALMSVVQNNVLSLFAVTLVFVLLVKPKINMTAARIVTVVLTLIIGYMMTFMIIKINNENKWYNYLLLRNVKVNELFNVFMAMFALCLFCEFGTLDASFGRTFLTAYRPYILIIIAIIISYLGNAFLLLIHTVILVIHLVLTSYKKVFNMNSFRAAIIFCFFILLVKAVRPLAFLPQQTSSVDKYLGTKEVDDMAVVLCYFFEFLCLCSFSSPVYEEVHNNERTRADNRKARQHTIDEIMEIDHKFCDDYFDYRLEVLKSGVVNLEFNQQTMPASVSLEILAHRDMDVVPENPEPQQNEQNENNENNQIQTQSTRSFYMSILKIIFGFIWGIICFIVDRLNAVMMTFTDINLEPGVNGKFLETLKDMFNLMHQKFRDTKVVEIPEDYIDFAKQIPLSYISHFQILQKLRNFKVLTPENRFPVFYHYVNLISRQIIPAVLIMLCFFYPAAEQSIFAYAFFFIALILLSFNIETYIPVIVLALLYMLMQTVIKCVGISDLVDEYISKKEKFAHVKLSPWFGFNIHTVNLKYLTSILIFAVFSQVYSFTHHFQVRRPWQRRYRNFGRDLSISEKLNNRINLKSAIQYHFSKLVIVFDIIAFVFALFFYLSWSKSSSTDSMISGSATITYDFVIFLMGNFVFLLLNQWVIISTHKLWLISFNLLYALFTFAYTVYLNKSFHSPSFRVFFLLRIISELILALQSLFGFAKVPPSIGDTNPLFVYIKVIIIQVVPFLFEFVNLIKWLSSTTSLEMFDFMILALLKNKFMKQIAFLRLFPLTSKKKSHLIGYLFTLILFGLLFVPFIVMMSSTQTSTPNPVKVASMAFGIYGLPDFWTGSTVPEDTDLFTENMQLQLINMSDGQLDPFYSNNKKQSQFIEFPDLTLTNWIVSSSSAKYALNKMKKFIPYATYKFTFNQATTKKNVQEVTITKAGKQMDNETILQIQRAINCTQGKLTECSNINFSLNNFFPLFFTVPLETDAKYIEDYNFNATVFFKEENNQYYWEIVFNKTDRMPNFVVDGPVSVAIYSKPTYDAVIGTLLSVSGGGFYGLYVFIILTIGTFVRSYIYSFFTDLWIDRMGKPEMFLNVILAIEAHRMAGDLRMEYATATMMLNTARSIHKMSKIAGVAEVEQA